MYQNFIEVACIARFFYLPYQKLYIPLPYYHWFYQVWLKYQPLTIWSFIYPTKIPIVPHHLHWFPLHHKLYLLCLLWPFFIRTLLSPWHMCLKQQTMKRHKMYRWKSPIYLASSTVTKYAASESHTIEAIVMSSFLIQ